MDCHIGPPHLHQRCPNAQTTDRASSGREGWCGLAHPLGRWRDNTEPAIYLANKEGAVDHEVLNLCRVSADSPGGYMATSPTISPTSNTRGVAHLTRPADAGRDRYLHIMFDRRSVDGWRCSGLVLQREIVPCSIIRVQFTVLHEAWEILESKGLDGSLSMLLSAAHAAGVLWVPGIAIGRY